MHRFGIRPVPRWLHVWAIVTVVATALLLVLGGFVTSFRVGMADPVWPTEPWYLISNYKLDFGYLVEHCHRIAGFVVALLGTVLTFAVWAYEPRRGVRWFGIAALVAFVVAFTIFQIVLSKAPTGQEGAPVYVALAVMVVTLGLALAAAYRAWAGGGIGGLVRAVVVFGMFAAMTQGLLGGVRVRYNELAGQQLAAVHGVVGQVVFALLIAVAVLTARPRPGPALSTDVAGKLRWQTFALVLFTFAQIVWGAWVRHFPGTLSSRLHLMFAFVVVGFATLAIKQALSDPTARGLLKGPARWLMALITVQVLLGVEAWIGKFMTGTLPELERITAAKALLRTAHAHVGAWVLAVSVMLALVARRNPTGGVGPPTAPFLDSHQTPASEPVPVGR